MQNSFQVIQDVGKEYGALTGRPYGFFESVGLEDAEYVIIALGSAAGTVRNEVECLREQGVPIGMIKLRVFRPFPAKELVAVLKGKKAVAVLDRSDTFAGGMGGPVFIETRSALYDEDNKPLLVNYVYGLGGRDLPVELVNKVATELKEIAQNGQVNQLVNYLGLRE